MTDTASTYQDFSKIYDKYEYAFEKHHTPSFHNFLWALLLGKVYTNSRLEFCIVLRNARMEIALSEKGQGMCYPTNVAFVVSWSDATNVCFDLNALIFGVSERPAIKVMESTNIKA